VGITDKHPVTPLFHDPIVDLLLVSLLAPLIRILLLGGPVHGDHEFLPNP
jgi:hypothetical protein